jgi:hypothetical protein
MELSRRKSMERAYETLEEHPPLVRFPYNP